MKSGKSIPIFGLVLAVCCAPQGPYVWARDVPPSPEIALRSVPLRPGDTVQVTVKGQPELSAEGQVRTDGTIAMPVIGPVTIAGATAQEAARQVQERLARVVVSPEVTVSLATRAPVPVTVVGEVRTPGRFELEPQDGVLGAIARAGGLTEFAKRSRIFVLRSEPQPVRVRFEYGELQRGEPSGSYRLQRGDVVVVE